MKKSIVKMTITVYCLADEFVEVEDEFRELFSSSDHSLYGISVDVKSMKNVSDDHLDPHMIEFFACYP